MKLVIRCVFVVFWTLMSGAAIASVTFQQRDDLVNVIADGRCVASYVFDPNLPKPSLVGVTTPGGRRITRRWPLTELAGGSMDHEHHVGIFFCVDGVNGTNFWNYYKNSDGREPKIRHVRIDTIQRGHEYGVLETTSQWIDKHGDFLLEEDRTMLFTADPVDHLCSIDLVINLTAQREVIFEDIEEGVLGIRLNDYLRETERGIRPDKDAPIPEASVKGTGRYFSSTGEQTAAGIWGKRHRWVALQGVLGDGVAGLAVFDHPDSINHPTYWHVRDYGLMSANPLGQGDFQRQQRDRKNPVKPLRLKLEKGQTAHFRFMVVLFDGVRREADIEQWYRQYAK